MAQPKKKFGLARGINNLINKSSVQKAEQASFRRGSVPATSAASGTSTVSATKTAVPIPPANVLQTLPFRDLPIDKISASPNQSRKNFDGDALNELADSIRAEGLMQPIVVREKSKGEFQLIAGERRWRACKLIGMKTVTARVVKASDASSAAMTLIENLQRENLDPIEEAFGIGSLMRDFNLTQEAVSERLGKARSSVANSLRLLSLDREIQGYISKGQISVGHAKVLLGIDNDMERLLLARRFVESGCSVRDAEKFAKKIKDGVPANPAKNDVPVVRQISSEIFKIEKNLCSHLHTKVQVKHGKNSGKIIIEYHGNDDLARLLECFGMASKNA